MAATGDWTIDPGLPGDRGRRTAAVAALCRRRARAARVRAAHARAVLLHASIMDASERAYPVEVVQSAKAAPQSERGRGAGAARPGDAVCTGERAQAARRLGAVREATGDRCGPAGADR